MRADAERCTPPRVDEVQQVAVGERVHYHGRNPGTGQFQEYAADVVDVVVPFDFDEASGEFFGGVVALAVHSVNGTLFLDEIEHGPGEETWSRMHAPEFIRRPTPAD